METKSSTDRSRIARCGYIGKVIGAVKRFRRRCSLRGAAGLALCLCGATVIVIVLSYALGSSGDDSREIGSQFGNMAQLLGSVGGILFAVMVFAVEFQIDRAEDLAKLAKFLHRQSGMIMDAGILVGLIAGLAIGSLGVSIGIQPNRYIGLGLASCYVVLGLFITLGHLVRAVSLSTSSMTRSICNAVRFEVSELLDLFRAKQEQYVEFERMVAGAGFVFKHFSFYGDFGATLKSQRFALQKKGEITAMRWGELRELFEHLATKPGWSPLLCLAPGDWSVAGPALILNVREHAATAVSDDEGMENKAVVPGSLDDAFIRRAQVLLDRAYVVEPPTTWLENEVGEVVRALIESACHAAMERDNSKFSDRISALQELAGVWDTGSDSAAFYNIGQIDFFGMGSVQQSLRPLVHAAGSSTSRPVLHETDLFLVRHYETALNGNNVPRIRDYLALINDYYDAGTLKSEINPAERLNRFDSLCRMVCHELHIEHMDSQKPRSREALVAVLSGLMRLIRQAIERGNSKEAGYFLSQTFKVIMDARRFGEIRRDQSDSIHRLFRFGIVLMAGWAIKVCREKKESSRENENAAAAFKECVKHCYGLSDLMSLWEEDQRRRHGRVQSWQTEFGAENWDTAAWDNLRPGFPATWAVDVGWVFDGLLALMAATTSEFTPVEGGSDGNWFGAKWETNFVSRRLDALSKISWLSSHLSDERKQLVIGKIAARQKSLLIGELKSVITSPVSLPLFEALKQRLLVDVPVHEGRERANALNSLGVAGVDGLSRTLPAVRARWALRKEDFIVGAQHEGSSSEMIAEDLCRRASICIFGGVEDSVPESAQSVDKESVTGAIQDAVTSLNSIGFSPNILLIPASDLWRVALFGRNYWEAAGKIPSLGYHHVGTFHGLTTLLWPYDDAESIVVADSTRLFASAALKDATERFTATLMPTDDAEARNRLAQLEKNEVEMEEVSSSANVKIFAEFELELPLGIGDTRAGVKFRVAQL